MSKIIISEFADCEEEVAFIRDYVANANDEIDILREALEEEAKDSRELLRDILKDITSDNMLSPDVFDRLVSEVKRYE